MAERTFEDALDAVYPSTDPQINVMRNLNFYRSLKQEQQKEINDALLRVLRVNFPFINYNNVTGVEGVINSAYADLASYKARMNDIVGVTSPMFAEIFARIPTLAFSAADFDLNGDEGLYAIANFEPEKISTLLTYNNASSATAMLLSFDHTFQMLLDNQGDRFDVARLIVLAAFTGTNYLFGLDKPLFPMSLTDNNDTLVESGVSFFPNRLYGVKGSIAEAMVQTSRHVVSIQVALTNIASTLGNNWVEKLLK